ncbi:MAG TPA: integrase core domain-containing protein [Fimbriimonadaceae bacterium]|nr:integrase core domain-containing protein [Fimbriimonadaceae bacterium]
MARSVKSLRVQKVLAGLFDGRGAPEFLRSDNGSEFISRSLAVFLSQSSSGSHFIRPSSPCQNAYIESFNSTLRRDCPDVEVFCNLADPQVRLSLCRRFYYEDSSLGYRTPPGAMSHYTEHSS